jgi:hypothetical protein
MKDPIEILFINTREKRSVIKDIRNLRKRVNEYLYDKKDLFIADYIDLISPNGK